MSKALPKVLIVEDDKSLQRLFASQLKGSAKVVSAVTIESAESLFWEHCDLDAIAVDGCVPGNELNTVALVRDFRAHGFRGPIIAIASRDEDREALCEAGCDYECHKRHLAATLREILKS